MRVRTYILRLRERVKCVLTLFIGPLAITLLADLVLLLVKHQSIPDWQLVTTLMLMAAFVILIVVGYTDRLDQIFVCLRNRRRSRKFRRPRILVLDGRLEEDHEVPPRAVHSDFQPSDWRQSFRKVFHDVNDIDVGPLEELSRLQKYQVVVNPFGEVYPEVDTYSYTTFSQICDYVFSGGVFVNVAGIPFWYCHDPRDPYFTGKNVVAGPIRRELASDGEKITQRPLFAGLFPQLRPRDHLGDKVDVDCVQSRDEHRRFGDIAGAGGNPQAMIFRAYRPGTPGLIPLLRSEGPDWWIIVSLKYGDGYFLIAGMELTERYRKTGFAKVVAAVKGWVDYEAHGRP